MKEFKQLHVGNGKSDKIVGNQIFDKNMENRMPTLLTGEIIITLPKVLLLLLVIEVYPNKDCCTNKIKTINKS